MLAPLQTKLGGVFCVTVNAKRQIGAESCFKHLGLTPEFFLAETDARGALASAYENHRAMMQLAIERDCQNALITEDSIACLTNPTQQSVDEVLRFLETDMWDVLFLGTAPCIEMNRTRKIEKFQFIRQVHAFQTHAYIVSRKFMEKFVTLPFETLNAPIEVVFSILRTAYAVFPTWFYQVDESVHSQIVLSKRPSTLESCAKKIALKAKTTYAQTVNVPTYWVLFGLTIAFAVLIVVLGALLYGSNRGLRRCRLELRSAPS